MECNICGCSEFLDMKNRERVRCRSCNSLERTRILKLLLDKHDLVRPGVRVLHFAPEENLSIYIKGIVGEGFYDPMDINPEQYRGINVTRFDLISDSDKLPSESYDLIIHSHVMEHLPCNITAVLFHLHRALTKEGAHLFSVPIISGFYEESCFPISAEEKKKRFGQFDHVRRFGVEDLDRSIGMIFSIPKAYDLTREFSLKTLEHANIPESTWRGYSGSSVLLLRKDDLLLRETGVLPQRLPATEDPTNQDANQKPVGAESMEQADGHPEAVVETAASPVTWVSPTEFRFDGLSFTCDATTHLNRPTDEQRIIIAKSRSLIDELYEQLSPIAPQTMLEIGIAQGGSAFLHTSLFELSKYVGLDRRPEDPKVLGLLKKKYNADRVKLYYQTSQTDKARIAQICNDEFGGLCDVVIDDGSHQYELSAQTLEVALPHVRPGGLYVIEDWSWAHWPGAKWQDPSTGYNRDKSALSNLVFELTMLCASRPDILSGGVIRRGFVAFRRGPANLDWRTFKLSESYLTQGRAFRPF